MDQAGTQCTLRRNNFQVVSDDKRLIKAILIKFAFYSVDISSVRGLADSRRAFLNSNPGPRDLRTDLESGAGGLESNNNVQTSVKKPSLWGKVSKNVESDKVS